jgi:hypothetical protein
MISLALRGGTVQMPARFASVHKLNIRPRSFARIGKVIFDI